MTTNLTLYNDARHSEEDIYAYEWEDLADGLITNEHGSVIKLLCDQMTADDTVLLIEPMSGTGKTAKFIIDNAETPANIPKIVTQDVFQNTFLYCGEFFEIVEDDPRVFQNTITPDTLDYNMAGEVQGVTKHYDDADDIYIDLNVDPEVRSKIELGEIPGNVNADMSTMLNVNGDALGQEHEVFAPTLIVLFPFPISLGYPLHEAEGLVGGVISSLRKLPVGGVLALMDIHYERVNVQMWRGIDCVKDIHGYEFEQEWLLGSLPDGSQSVYKAAIIKRIN
jgi:hypothetical protein|tara:strand:+ start:984 stop:1823 length:840 start_codon:yes stop_codon:yes gene_type:complete